MENKLKFGIGIPTYNRYDLLKPCLFEYFSDFPDAHIYLVDNGQQKIFADGLDMRQVWNAKNRTPSFEGLTLMENQENVGVGASWNQLCREIFKKNDYALILNDDVYLGKSQSVIEGHIEKGRDFVRATPDWCVFLISKKLYEKVGPFDECFMPAYFEDKSYEHRMRIKGYKAHTRPDLNPLVYRSSQTIEKEPTILDQSKKNKKLYIEMWGGEPGKEKYSAPFNGKPNNS